jgi:hypothetical protein
MDRVIVYPGQVPLETDLLNTNKYAMLGLGRLAAAVTGPVTTGSGLAEGLVVAATSTPSLSVTVSPGSMYSSLNVDSTAYSSVPADTTAAIPKQGILLNAQTIDCSSVKPSSGYRIVTIAAVIADSDADTTVLPYYNSANTAVALNGSNGSGVPQSRRRTTTLTLRAAAGGTVASGNAPLPSLSGGEVGLASFMLRSTTTSISTSTESTTNANIIPGKVTSPYPIDGSHTEADPHIYPPYASLNAANVFSNSALWNAIVTFGQGANSSQDATTVNAIPRLSQFSFGTGSNGAYLKIPAWNGTTNKTVQVNWGTVSSNPTTANAAVSYGFAAICGSAFANAPRVIVSPAFNTTSNVYAWQDSASTSSFNVHSNLTNIAIDFAAFGY